MTLVHTGQHYDADMSQVFLDELGLPRPDVFLGVGSGSHGEQTAKALVGVERVLLEHGAGPDRRAGRRELDARRRAGRRQARIPIAHLEAGLRSYDPGCRKSTTGFSPTTLSLLLVHSESALDNLAREGIDLELAPL